MSEFGATGSDPSRTSAKTLRTNSVADVEQAHRDAVEFGCRGNGEPFADRSLTGDQRVAAVGLRGNNALGPRFGGLLAPPVTGASRYA